MSREYSLCAYSHWDQFLQGVSLQVFTTSGGTLHGLPHSFIVLALYSASCEYDLMRVYIPTSSFQKYFMKNILASNIRHSYGLSLPLMPILDLH